MLPFALAFAAGFLVKWVDWLDDDRKSKGPAKYAIAAAYGLIIGYLIGTASFSVLFVAALVAQVFARKVDTAAHRVGYAATAAALLAFGFPPMEPGPFALFLALAFLDEADYIGRLRPLAEWRPFLPAGALLMLFFGRWDYAAGILLFDLGYRLFARAVPGFRPPATGSRRTAKGSGRAKNRKP